jgi:exosortase B
MNATLSTRYPTTKPWFIIVVGLVSLYGPTYWNMVATLRHNDDQLSSLFVSLLVTWLCWGLKAKLFAGAYKPSNVIGSILLVFGLLLYILGRSQDIIIFEEGSQIPVFAGTLLLMHGASSVRVVWFPLVFIAFMVPMPGVLVDALTGPLKQWISVLVENALYGLGYPIARSGVMLMIGQYQLLVADACSGLNSMFSLSALGMLFMYLTGRKSYVNNVIMLVSILPIAFAANVLRVAVLVLVTYYGGDEAGQGFLHGFAGIVLFATALGCFFLLDMVLSFFTKKTFQQ